MKRFFRVLILLIISSNAFGQQKLSSEDLLRLQKRAEEYVYNFEFYIQQIAQSKLTQYKKADIISAINLFESKATIEVSNLKGIKRKYLISDYLNNVVAKYSERYGVVVIDFLATKIEKLKQKKDENGEIYYEGTFSFTQLFCAQKKFLNSLDAEKRSFAACDYSDKTMKKGKTIIRKVTTITGERWVLKLSDITVDETTDLDSLSQ